MIDLTVLEMIPFLDYINVRDNFLENFILDYINFGSYINDLDGYIIDFNDYRNDFDGYGIDLNAFSSIEMNKPASELILPVTELIGHPNNWFRLSINWCNIFRNDFKLAGIICSCKNVFNAYGALP